ARSSSIRCSFDNINCSTKYFVNDKFLAPEASIVNTLFGLTDPIRSIFEPVFKNFGEKPANGPKNKHSSPSINRVSKCGTDIGGAPTAALPYTFAVCFSTTSGFLATRNSPLTGNPPTCLLCGIFVFCNKGNAPPPAPINTCFAVCYSIAPSRLLRTFTSHTPSATCFKSSTSWWYLVVDPWISDLFNNFFVNEPKLTSVPASTFVAATGSVNSRFSIINGVHSAISSGSSVMSI